MKFFLGLLLELLQVVAPARERGLKLMFWIFIGLPLRRSREGAWIEIVPDKARVTFFVSLPRGSVD